MNFSARVSHYMRGTAAGANIQPAAPLFREVAFSFTGKRPAASGITTPPGTSILPAPHPAGWPELHCNAERFAPPFDSQSSVTIC